MSMLSPSISTSNLQQSSIPHCAGLILITLVLHVLVVLVPEHPIALCCCRLFLPQTRNETAVLRHG